MNIFKKRNWAFYLIEFLVFTIAYFLVDWLYSGLSLRRAIIGGLVGGVLMTILFWFFDQGFKHPFAMEPSSLVSNFTSTL